MMIINLKLLYSNLPLSLRNFPDFPFDSIVTKYFPASFILSYTN